MSPVFVPHTKAGEYTDFANKKFSAAVTAADAFVKGITWQQLAIYNWGTDVPAEVNRALEESVGLKVIDPKNPQNSEFDTSLGPGGDCKILLPKIWESDPLKENTVHRIGLKKRRPVPAVNIKALTRWFIPKDEPCKLKYCLEGSTATADKVDFEVFPTRYVEENKGGELVPATPHSDVAKEYIYQKEKLFEESSPATTPKPPAADRDFNTWKGESQATEGLLKHTSAGTYLSYAFAPYTIQLRYYRAGDDSKARILMDPFCPYWKLPATSGASEELEDESLVVTWKIKGDNDKLKVGQLIIWDNSDTQVFKVILNAANLRKGKYELLKGPPRAWEKQSIQKNKMPYRVQIQAHSDSNEESGLAIAVMHTAVKPFNYDEVQFVGLRIRPDVTTTTPKTYLGNSDNLTDITKRCDIMKIAIRAAGTHNSIKPGENTLKIFMAPEFFFRGTQGGYPIHSDTPGDPGMVQQIISELRVETDQFKYADWLFIFGTAIGFQVHADGSQKKEYKGDGKHNVSIMEIGGEVHTLVRVQSLLAKRIHASIKLGVKWKIEQGALVDEVLDSTLEDNDKCWLTLKSKKAFRDSQAAFLLEPVAWVLDVNTGANTKIKVKSGICDRIPLTITTSKFPWCVKQGGGEIAIEKCVFDRDDIYDLTLKGTPSIDKDKAIALLEPISTEVFNLALIRKGWPASLPTEKHLKSAVVCKENVSAIDFLGAHYGNAREWFDPTGSGREITIHGIDDRVVIPSSGSRDILGDETLKSSGGKTWHDVKGLMHRVGSEINVSGYGGGSVFSIDGITFGLEVCLDHGSDRLYFYYNNHHKCPNCGQPHKAAGDCWCKTPRPTLVPETKGAKPGEPLVQVQLIPSWGMSIGGGALCCLPGGLIFNVDGMRADSIARKNDGHFSCDRHTGEDNGTTAGNCPHCRKKLDYYWCFSCSKAFEKEPGATKCINDSNHTNITRVVLCKSTNKLFPYGNNCATPSCPGPHEDSRYQETPYIPIGSKIIRQGALAPVTASGITTYYKQAGNIEVFKAEKLPAAKAL